jgi:hypothetical protein
MNKNNHAARRMRRLLWMQSVRSWFRRWLLGRLGKSQVGGGPNLGLCLHPGPVAEQTCCGAVR